MERIGEYLKNVKKVAITGHMSPDGDCVGSCLGLWNYLRDNYPEITAHVFLQEAKESLKFLPGYPGILHADNGEDYDLMILLDISSTTRIAFAEEIYKRTEKSLCLDHHHTNPGGPTWMFNDPSASSACEVLYRFLDPAKISKDCAVCLYTGIVHDTGVFQYSSTSPETMRIAGEMMGKGVEFTRIIDESFFQRSYLQNRVLGEILADSRLYLDGLLVVGTMTRERRWKLGAKSVDLEGVVASLRNTQGTDVALFLHQLDDGEYKISLRSREKIDVSAIAAEFDGGGHVRASGGRSALPPEDIVKIVIEKIRLQLGEEA